MDDELLRDFLTESTENLQQLDCDVVALERNPGDRELLRGIFRTVHTIKGTCGFLGLERLEHVAHAAENVLVLLRDGDLAVDAAVIGDVLAALDVIRLVLAGLESTGEEPAGDDTALVAALDRWVAVAEGGEAIAAPEATPDIAPVAAVELAPVPVPNTPVPATPGPDTPAAPIAAAPPAPAPPEPEPAAAPAAADASLRVNVALLDRLMNMVGELVLTRNQLLQAASAAPDAGDAGAAFLAPVQQLNRVTTDLQEAVMKTRMQPVGAAWTKLPRLIRDLAAGTGKALDLEMHGATTELDRQVLQAIQDPLTHMVRNAADHGVEAPAARRAAGKTERGLITLNAYHEGGHVVVEVIDDGAGIDPARVRRKAVERGLASADAVAAMSDAQALRFVFEPGFSTAAAVTSVSGRGVGMDVVKSNIERIGGTVDLTSRLGHGCTVRVRIPLTLAIVPALVVRVGAHAFAVPQVGVVELVRLDGAARGVEEVGGARFLRLRDTLLPLVRLADVLGLAPAPGALPNDRDAADACVEGLVAEGTVVVCQVGAARFGAVVDEVYDTQEIVVKPVGRLVKHLEVFAGCTILGDGQVIMILDPSGLAERGRVADAEAAATAARAALGAAALAADAEPQTTTLLLFDTGAADSPEGAAPRAVPLAMVSRLEEVSRDQLEYADGRWVVQYRDMLLPVVPADPALDVAARDPRPLIVFRDGDRAMGLAVDAIRDIVDTELRLERRSTDPALLGVAVVGGRATEVVDIQYFLRQAREDWFAARPLDILATDGPGAPGAAAPAGPRRVLLVDDSQFFLGLIAPVVRSVGHHVVTSINGAEALERLDREERFDLILSDIDMPQVDGFEFARRTRALERARAESGAGHPPTPMIALTGRSTPVDEARAYDAGFDAFLTKFDRDAVLGALATHLSGVPLGGVPTGGVPAGAAVLEAVA